MNKHLHISIPTPCHENWAVMTPIEKGRFCGACQKAVHDFTRSSDREISALLAKEPDACGRFLNTQLNRDLIVPKDKSKAWGATSAAVLSFFTFGIEMVAAQTFITTEQRQNYEPGLLFGDEAVPLITIKGVVYDEELLPLPGANVMVKGTSRVFQTNFDGEFIIEVRKDDVLQFSFTGFKEQELRIPNNVQYLEIVLLESPIDDSVIIAESYTTETKHVFLGSVTIVNTQTIEESADSKRTFFGRIFHSIGKLFSSDE